MRVAIWPMLTLFCLAPCAATGAADTVHVGNGGFEQINPAGGPKGWVMGVAKNTKATIGLDSTVVHSGRHSIKITDQSPTAPGIFALLRSEAVAVEPETTYDIRFFAKAKNVSRCSVGVDLSAGDNYREPLPTGSYDWQPLTLTVATQPNQITMNVHFVVDGLTDALWIDDVTIALSSRQRAGLREVHYPREFPGMFPSSQGELARHLLVCDVTKAPDELVRPLAALQGIVNRRNPRIYLINRGPDPACIDEKWLAYMKEKGYTEQEERIADPLEILRRFRSEITGLIVFDPDLPGAINASWMLAGLKNALPVSPEVANTLVAALHVPVVSDLRGKWKRNVDAYRYVYDHYWDQMYHHALAWQFPPSKRFCTQDFLVEFNIFQFWVSGPDDHEPGGDPQAEMEFAHEILAHTPGAIPMFGWVSAPNLGISEYMFSHLCSEYGKFIPGTDLNSNASVHSAVRLRGSDKVLRQKSHDHPGKTRLEKDKVYVSFSIMDGDGISVWQGWWQRIFADPLRGAVPMGCGMELCTIDVMPLVQQWYYEHMTPNETFYALVYLNEPIFANRFRKEDRERIWNRWIQYVDEHCAMLDLDAVEVIWSGVRRPNLPKEGVLRRYTQGVKHLDYIVAELGRNTRVDIPTDECTYLLDNVVVFHTVNTIHTWGLHEDFSKWRMGKENAYVLQELQKYPPRKRPAFINILGLVWCYDPTWVMDLKRKLPPDYVLVGPGELARLYRESRRQRVADGPNKRLETKRQDTPSGKEN